MPTPQQPAIRLKSDRWSAVCNRYGLHTDADRATAIGVSRSQVIRVQNRELGAGSQFIRGALIRFRGFKFEDLFEVVA